MHRLGQSLDHAGDGDLVDHLGQLAAARGPHMPDRLGIGREHRLDPGKRVRIAADHDTQLAGLGACLSA